MAFTPAQGYGQLFSYDVSGIRGDGFEVQHLAGTIMRQAIGELVFSRMLNQSRDAFGVGKGGTFTIPVFSNWGAPTSVTPLTSGTAISVGTQTGTSVSMMMYEYGTGVGYEGLGNWITNLDVRSELINTLGLHIGRMINWLDYDILSKTKFSIEVRSTGSYTNLQGTNRALVATAFGELGPGGVALAYDSFRKSIVSPLTSRGFYVMVGNAETFRNLKQGSVFQNMSLYSDMRGLRWQVLGEYMNFLFVETEELLSKGTSFALGANTGGYGFGKNPTTFYYPDYGSDAARLQVWKTIFYRGQGPIWRDSGTTCIIVRSKTAIFDYGLLDG